MVELCALDSLGVPPADPFAPQGYAREQPGSGFPLQVRTRRSTSLAGFPLQSVTRNAQYLWMIRRSL